MSRPPAPGFAHDVAVVGWSHRTRAVAAVAGHAPSAEARPALARAQRREGIEAVVLLATCNRFEAIVARRRGVDVDRALAALRSALGEREGVEARRGVEAVRHVLSVAASLDSLVVGERQIVRQLRA